MMSSLHREFAEAAVMYAATGHAKFAAEQYQQRLSKQYPTVFGLPSLRAEPYWSTSSIGCFLDRNVVRAISREYHEYHRQLRSEKLELEVSNGEWEAMYLMEEGRWLHSPSSRLVTECFSITSSVLSTFSVFETGLGYVYFSRVAAGTVIRPHNGPTNCKLRVQIVLYGEEDVEGTGVEERVLGRLTVAEQQQEYRAGETVVFDDSFLHSVEIPAGDVERVVLLVDIWHPELLMQENADVQEGVLGMFPPMSDCSENASVVTATVSQRVMEGAEVVTAAAEVVMSWNEMQQILNDESGGLVVDSVVQCTGEVAAEVVTMAMPVTATAVLSTEENAETRGIATAEAVCICGDGMTDNQQQGQQQNKDDVSGNSHGACTKSQGHISTSQNRFVRAVDVFVSVPSVGDEFSGYPRSAEYAKSLSLLSAEDMRSHEYLFKILLVGDMCSRIGKSSYLLRAAENIFLPDSYPTIGVDFKIINRGFSHPICKPSTEAPLRIKMQLWDTAGPERFRTITRAYYRGAHGYLVFFDLTSRISFENLPLWMAEIAKYGNSPNTVVLVGMKSDRPWEEAHVTETRHPAVDRDIEAGTGAKQGVKQMEGEKEDYLPTEPAVSNAPWTLGYRSVTSEEAAATAAQYNIPYIECSALSGENVQDVLATMVHEIFVSKEELRQEIPITRAPAPGQRPSRNVCALS